MYSNVELGYMGPRWQRNDWNPPTMKSMVGTAPNFQPRIVHFAKIWYRVRSCHSRYTAIVHGQRVKGQDRMMILTNPACEPESKSGSPNPKEVEEVLNVAWRLVGLLMKAENDWCNVGWPSSCNASQMPPFSSITYLVIRHYTMCDVTCKHWYSYHKYSALWISYGCLL